MRFLHILPQIPTFFFQRSKKKHSQTGMFNTAQASENYLLNLTNIQ
jgi:hypothetical protein